MRVSRTAKIQLVVFGVIALIAGTAMAVGYVKVPALLGFGQYTVSVELPTAAGLYATGNVTYRGTEVGRVSDVRLTDTGVLAVLTLRSDIPIPSDLDAQVHSASGIGEQYLALQPRSDDGPVLKAGDVIPEGRTSVPPDINSLLDAANRSVVAIPADNVRTVVDESYTALGGLGPELARIVDGSTQLAIDARKNLDPLLSLIDQTGPVLDTQSDTSEAIRGWANHLADITRQLEGSDSALVEILENGSAAADEGRALIDRLKPTLPVLLANLVSVNPVLITYQPALEQLLVLLPEGTAIYQAGALAERDTKNGGQYLSFNLNVNLPPPCTTGFLPAQQRRSATLTDVPEPPEGEFYCRIPQDSSLTAVRGARNYPCLAQPGKRAPTAKMCESAEAYVPLNDGTNWKGDPNATLTGQDIPAGPPPAAGPLPAGIAAAEYDPATGEFVGPDGKTYTRTDLAHTAPQEKTWQTMLTPPES